MKKKAFFWLMALSCLLSACFSDDKNALVIGISPDYPPFESIEKGEIVGFDVDLGRLVAKALGKTAVFKNIPFNGLIPALMNGRVDCVMSTMAITEERALNVDFSEPYFYQSFALVSYKDKAYDSLESLHNKKVATQLGTTMETLLKPYIAPNELMLFDQAPQAIEALKSHLVKAVLLDANQARRFAMENPAFIDKKIDSLGSQFAIVFPKNSPLIEAVNIVLVDLKKNGSLSTLKERWFPEQNADQHSVQKKHAKA